MGESLWPTHKKPSACSGCPRERTGRGFVPGHGTLAGGLVIIGEQPGENEVVEGKPFVGRSGQVLDSALGGNRTWVFITNVRKCLGGESETPEERRASIEHCTSAYLQTELDRLEGARSLLLIGADAARSVFGGCDMRKYHQSVWRREEVESIQKARALLIDGGGEYE